MNANIAEYFRDLYYSAVSVFSKNEQSAEIEGTKAYFYCNSPGEYKDFYKFTQNFSEKEVLKKIVSEASEGDVFYDIGAKVGVYSCFLGRGVNSIDLMLFEPHPNNASRCRKNLEINGLHGKVREQIVSDHSGKTELYLQTAEPGVGTHSTVERSEESVRVETVTLDKVAKEWSSPDIIKIDVEGAEDRVIGGMSETLNKYPPGIIVIEVHHNLLQDDVDESIHQPLRSAGYDLQELDRRVNRPNTTTIWAAHQGSQ